MRTLAVWTVVVMAGPSLAAPPVTGTVAPDVALPVPAKATVVFHVNGWGKARGRLNALVEKSFPADAKAVKERIDAGLSEALDGRELKGIEPDGRVLVSINDLKALDGETFPGDFFVPVKDPAAFRDGFFKDGERKDLVKKANGVSTIPLDGTPMFLVEKTGYVILTASEDRATEYAGKYETLQTKRMGPDVATTFLNSDVSLFVDLDKINDEFGEEIKQFRGLIDFAFQNAGGNIPGLDKSQIEAAKDMMKGLFQVVEDGRALVVGAEFRPEGLSVRLQARFEKESKTAKVLEVETPNAHADLGKLPAGFTEYHAARFGPAISEMVEKLVRDFAAGEDQDDAANAVEKFLEVKKAGAANGTMTASRMPDTSVNMTEYKDPASVLAAQMVLLKALPAGASHSNLVLKDKPVVKESAQTFKGTTFHQVSVVYDFEATAKKIPEPAREATLEGLKKQAKEKQTYWVGATDKALIQVSAPDWEAAQKVLDRSAANAGADAAFQATRSQLPAEASFLALQEIGHVMSSIADQLAAVGGSIPGLPFELPKINKVTANPSFIGVAVVLKPEVGQVDLFVPAAAADVVRKALEEK
jgi:hypothetical protein